MRAFNYKTEYRKLLNSEIVGYLTKIHEYKGRQNLFIEAQKGALSGLQEIARIQSIGASNRIEGIVTTDERLKKIVRDKTLPQNQSEREIAGYRDVLAAIHENYAYIPIRPGMILQLHRDLYRYSGTGSGGSFKSADNVIGTVLPDGTRRISFKPVPAWETPEMMDRLCEAIDQAMSDPEMDPLLLIPMFILDFLCVHPFSDGNGRMSRLLTLLMLYRSGYGVGSYISIERLIMDTRDGYYEALRESSKGWHEGAGDHLPFVRYMLGIIAAAYREFSRQAEILVVKRLSKPGRVREIIRNESGKVTKKEIMEQCPDISQKTVERALTELMETGEITKIGGGRYTKYIWNGEKD